MIPNKNLYRGVLLEHHRFLMNFSTNSTLVSYQWNKDEEKDDSSACQESSAEQGSEYIDEDLQCVGGHDYDGKHNACHIDSSSYVLGIVETFDLHLAYGEGQEECNDLEQHLVAIQDTQEDVNSGGVTNVDEVISCPSILLCQYKQCCKVSGIPRQGLIHLV